MSAGTDTTGPERNCSALLAPADAESIRMISRTYEVFLTQEGKGQDGKSREIEF